MAGGRGKAGLLSAAEAGRNLGKAERVREDSAASPPQPLTSPQQRQDKNVFASKAFHSGLRLADRRQGTAHRIKALFRRVGLE